MSSSVTFASRFDYFHLFEKPTFVLCNPNRERLYAMKDIYDIQAVYRYNASSEISFKVPKEVNGVAVEYYDAIEYPRLVYIQDVGYFVIVAPNRSGDSVADHKEVTAYSLDYTLAYVKLTAFSGTYKFYDLVDPTGTLLQILIGYLPGWTIGDVDASLLTKYRTFDLDDITLFAFLMENVEKAYQCVFSFDIENKIISASVPSVDSAATDVFISTDNLLKEFHYQPISEELVTALSVYGAGDLSINTVNPLGGNTIYNYEYFENTNWMSQGLIDALNTWEANIAGNQGIYASLLALYKDYNAHITTLEGELVDLEAELDALELVRKVRIEGGHSLGDITAQINAKGAEVDAKEAEIALAESTAAGVLSDLQAINDLLARDNNFTAAQLEELAAYTFGSTYQNENFVQTDSMSNSEIQDMAQELYDQAQAVLAKIAVPRYTFSVDSVNFLFLEEYETFIDQLSLGCMVTVRTDETTLYPVLLEVSLSYDHPDDFSLTFSNRMRLDTAEYIYGDIMGESKSAEISTNFNSEMWSNWTDQYKDDVSNFIRSSLDASLNTIINSANQEIVLDQSGLRGRRYLPETGTYSPEQLWVTSNLIAFTDDGWNTAKLALGKIEFNGISSYGLVAETLIGNIVASNELIITNEFNTFRVDEGGVTIIDGDIDITTENGLSHILIDPTNGIKIQARNLGGDWVDRFYADAQGNLSFTGALKGATGDFTGRISANEGDIGGIIINAKGIQVDSNYIRANGDFKWGMLTMSGGVATFAGNIYADNLLGLIQFNQIGSVNADTIVTGTLRAVDIYGCNIYWPGAYLHSRFYGSPEIYGEQSLKLSAGNADFYKYGIWMAEQSMTIRNPHMITIGGLTPTPFIRLIGSLYTMDSNNSVGFGKSETLVVNTPNGNRNLNFINGLLTTPNSTGGIPENQTYFSAFGLTATVPVNATGVVGHTEIPFDCKIESVRITSEDTCTVVADISNRKFASFSQVTDASLSGGAGIALVNAKTNASSLAGWTTELLAGDYLVFSIETATGEVPTINISIKGKR